MPRSSDWRTICGLCFIAVIFFLTSFALYLCDEAGYRLASMCMYRRDFDFWVWMEVIHDHRTFSLHHCVDVPFVFLIASGGYVHWWRARFMTPYIISTIFLLAVCYLILCNEMWTFQYEKRMSMTPKEFLDTLPDIIKYLENTQNKWRIDLMFREENLIG